MSLIPLVKQYSVNLIGCTSGFITASCLTLILYIFIIRENEVTKARCLQFQMLFTYVVSSILNNKISLSLYHNYFELQFSITMKTMQH